MFCRTWKKTSSQKQKGDVKDVSIEIRNEKLIIDGYTIGNEEELIAICEKAVKYDELKASFKVGGA